MTKEKVYELDNEIALKCHEVAKKMLSEPVITKQQFDCIFELIKHYESFITYQKQPKNEGVQDEN